MVERAATMTSLAPNEPANEAGIYESMRSLHALLSNQTCRDDNQRPRQLTPASAGCAAALFHGKLALKCLSRQAARALPCVRKLLVTGTEGSGTTNLAQRLRASGFQAVHETHYTQSQVLVSWFSRTDHWQLGSRNSSQQAWTLRASGSRRAWRLSGIRAGTHNMGAISTLNACLYHRVLLLVREPLRAIRSIIYSFLPTRPDFRSWLAISDALMLRSGSEIPLCHLHAVPRIRTSCCNNSKGRAHILRYAARYWFAWNTAALAVADGVIHLEKYSMAQVCALGGLNTSSPACSSSLSCARACGDSRPVYGRKDSLGTGRSHIKSGRDILPVTWPELCQADQDAAGRAYALANRLGYSYSVVDEAACAEGSYAYY